MFDPLIRLWLAHGQAPLFFTTLYHVPVIVLFTRARLLLMDNR